jgi:ketosteroid isomerase-like protein
MAMTDHEQIRALIESWATAVRASDISGILANHAPEKLCPDPFGPTASSRRLDGKCMKSTSALLNKPRQRVAPLLRVQRTALRVAAEPER